MEVKFCGQQALIFSDVPFLPIHQDEPEAAEIPQKHRTECREKRQFGPLPQQKSAKQRIDQGEYGITRQPLNPDRAPDQRQPSLKSGCGGRRRFPVRFANLGKPGEKRIIIFALREFAPAQNQTHCVEGLKGEFWYHFRLELYNHMLPCYLDVLLRDWKDFPLIRYRDVSMPYDYETREPIHLQYNKSRGKFQYGYHDYT